MRWFGVRRWVVVQLPGSWPTDRRNGNNDTTKSKCNNSYIGNMHQWVRAGTKTSSFRINNGGGALLEIDLPHCSKKGTGTQRIREGGWMGVCACEVGAVGRHYCCIHRCCCCCGGWAAGGGPRLTLLWVGMYIAINFFNDFLKYRQ